MQTAYILDSFKKHGFLAAFSRGRLNLSAQNNTGFKENRKLFLEKLDINYEHLVCLQQVHGNKVYVASKKDKGKGSFSYDSAIAGYDAIITQEKVLPLAVFTADCLSVFLYDPLSKSAGIVHAGWRGTKENIVLEAVSTMKKVFSALPQNLICALGPALRFCCYEVGEEFKDCFPQDVVERAGKLFLDNVGANYKQLINSGVLKKNIIDCKICTSCENEDLFSYRKEGNSAGRMMSVVMIA